MWPPCAHVLLWSSMERMKPKISLRMASVRAGSLGSTKLCESACTAYLPPKTFGNAVMLNGDLVVSNVVISQSPSK